MLKLLLIGGSNFVITNGIRKQLPEILGKSINADLQFHNIAVGGTGSLLGLERIIEIEPKESDFDIILIEYGINDWGLYRADRGLWQSGFEALFQKLRRNWPRAALVNVILGRRDQRFWPIQEKMHDQMAFVANAYQGTTINIDKCLKSLTGKQPFDQFYRDDAHIAEPIFTHHVALIIANHILGIKEEKIHQSKIVNAIRQKRLSIFPIEKDKVFKNSQFSVCCKRIDYGETLIIKSVKVPHTISFVSTKESGALRIAFNGGKIILNTAQGESNQKLEFVIKHTAIEGVFSDGDRRHENAIDIEIAAIDPLHDLWEESIVQKVWATASPTASRPSIYIINIGHIESYE